MIFNMLDGLIQDRILTGLSILVLIESIVFFRQLQGKWGTKGQDPIFTTDNWRQCNEPRWREF